MLPTAPQIRAAQAQCGPTKPWDAPRAFNVALFLDVLHVCSHRWFDYNNADLAETPKPPLLESRPRPGLYRPVRASFSRKFVPCENIDLWNTLPKALLHIRC